MADGPKQGHGAMLAQISNGLSSLHTEFYGKGPTKAKAHFMDDTVVCMLWNGFTTVELTLIDESGRAEVETFRRAFQTAMEDRFRRVVEEATGRKILAYMSQVHVDPNLAVELFLLEPADADAANADGGDHAAEPGQPE